MKKTEDYELIKSILGAYTDSKLTVNKGHQFHFLIYMNDTMSNTGIEALELSPRSLNCLHRSGIETIGHLCETVQCSRQLDKIRNCGKTSSAEIMDKLFYYQYQQLKPAERDQYIVDVLRANGDNYI